MAFNRSITDGIIQEYIRRTTEKDIMELMGMEAPTSLLKDIANLAGKILDLNLSEELFRVKAQKALH
jgi:hypothetical protein